MAGWWIWLTGNTKYTLYYHAVRSDAFHAIVLLSHVESYLVPVLGILADDARLRGV